jgi:hypothetical protein
MSKKHLAKLDEYISNEKPEPDDLLTFIADLANSNEPTMRTIASRFSLLKKHVRDTYPSYPDSVLRKIAPPIELTQSIIDKDKETRNAKQDVSFDQDLIDTILALKDSSNIFERFIFLQFVSGRRISEIFESPVKAVAKKTDVVKMKLSKKRGKDDKFHTVELMGGTLDSSHFRKLLGDSRKAITGMNLSDFTNRVNRTMRRAVRKDLSSHSLRGLYGVYRYHTDNPAKQNLVGFISRVLNHGDSSESGMNYASYSFEQ